VLFTCLNELSYPCLYYYKKICQEYERKEKQVDVRKKIEFSMHLNASWLKVLQAQDDVVNKMKGHEEAAKELLSVRCDHCVYKNLLKDLVIQSLLRVKEPSVLLRCRKKGTAIGRGCLGFNCSRVY
jgi:V-type H+-transporting ATPase subunit E